MNDFYNGLINAMEEAGFYIQGDIDINKSEFQRFKSRIGGKNPDIFVKIQGNCDGATFGDWHDCESWMTWWAKNPKEFSINDRRERQLKIEEERRKLLVKQNILIKKCNRFFSKISTVGASQHVYVLRKEIFPYYAKCFRKTLAIPVRDVDYELKSLQFIKTNGFKKFKHGAPIKGNMIWLSEHLDKDYDGVIRICEGWSTGCTIRDITKSPVICALNANNMVDVAVQLRRKYVHAALKICADNDQWGKENTGMKYAFEASHLTGATVYWPDFHNLDLSYVTPKPTDFNDLCKLAGSNLVKKNLIAIKKHSSFK